MRKVTVANEHKSKISVDILMILTALLAVFTFLSLISHSPDDASFTNIIFSTYQDTSTNYFGKAGAYISDLLGTVFGTPSLIIPFLLIYLTILLYKSNRATASKYAALAGLIYGMLIILVLSILFGLIVDSDPYFIYKKAGGALGVIASAFVVSLIGTIGGIITFMTLLLILVMLLFSLSFTDMTKMFLLIYKFIQTKIANILASIKKPDSKKTDDVEYSNSIDIASTNLGPDKIDTAIKTFMLTTDSIDMLPSADNFIKIEVEHNQDDVEDIFSIDTINDTFVSEEKEEEKKPKTDDIIFVKQTETQHEKIVPEAIKPIATESGSIYKNYHIPVNILDEPDKTIKPDSDEELKIKADLLVQKLADFGVNGYVRAIYPGPVVTMFEYEPAAGTRISKIATLENDLALNMSALSIRIIAPIPGKNAVGIEVPNKNRAAVYIKELLQIKEFNDLKAPLTVALGKDAVGKPYFTDIAKMPHLLVAGTTGSGKSVGINTMICSILYKSSPDRVKFIMVDPKMVELSIYNGIPHLLAPVVTDPKLASSVLKNVATEMDKRYTILAEHRVRNLEGFNALADTDPTLEKMHYLVVVVDEFADLMMIAGKDVEFSITRIAQKARAVGIHLIIATQRPTANVITGLIKSNMPARIAFKVSQKNDSRVILDQNGADMLLGRGDSLFMPPGSSDLIRVHGAFVSDEEVRNIVEHLKQYGEPQYNMEMVKEVKEPSSEDRRQSGDDDYDEKYEDALAIVRDKGQASISLIQRHLKIGYNRAARMVDMMEQEGIITPSDGTARPREVIKR